MRRQAATGPALATTLALALAGLLGPAATSAPAPAPRAGTSTTAPVPGDVPGAGAPVTGVPRGDRNGDRISDEFEPRLRSAPAGELFSVIITGLGASAAQAAVGRFAVTHRFPLVDGFAARMTAAQARGLARLPSVRRVDQNGTVHLLDDATNRDFGATTARTNGADSVSGDLTGAGVGICIVDTGIDPRHEQLNSQPITFHNAVTSRTDPFDDQGHGTHVASIAAGDGVGGGSASSFMGVAPGVSIFAAKALDWQGYGTDAQVLDGVNWCAAQADVDVISMSLGDTKSTDGTDILSYAVNQAVAAGKVVVVAAGNSGDQPGSINTPGVAASAITVGAVSDWSAPAGTRRHDDGIFLAPWSSRGPTLDGRIKPDIAAPGYSVTAAAAGTVSGYTTLDGTSMATPYVAGAVALALQADSAATPAGIKAALMATAAERGAPGTDNEWGAGLIDVQAFVDAVAQRSDQGFDTSVVPRTPFPAAATYTGTVPRNGYVDIPVTIPADGGGVPLALTLTITSGSAICYYSCLIVEWGPDLDLQLRNQAGTVLAKSECALSGLICVIGRQETIGYANPTAGTTYTVRVLAFTGDPNRGKGGSFRLDVSRGPAAAAVSPCLGNVAPTANAGPNKTYRVSRKTGAATFKLDGTASSDPDGTISSWAWTGTGWSGSGATPTLTVPVGQYTYELAVTDDCNAVSQPTDSVTITVTN